IMGPIAVAICIPPLGMGLATFLNKRKYQPAEKETGKASFTRGLFGITEGAIPFAAQDPLRVIPSIMVGSITGSVIAMLGNDGDLVAHGGPIVAVLGAVDNVLMFFIAAIIGTIVTAVMINLLKKDVMPASAAATSEGVEVTANETDGMTDASEQTNEDQQADEAEQQPMEDNVVINKLTDILNRDLMTMNVSGSTKE